MGRLRLWFLIFLVSSSSVAFSQTLENSKELYESHRSYQDFIESWAKQQCESERLDYDWTKFYINFRKYFEGQGFDKDLLEVQYRSGYADPFLEVLEDFRYAAWPIRELLDQVGVIRGKDAANNRGTVVLLYNQYRVICSTRVERWEDTPDLFDLEVSDCMTLVNHSLRYFRERGLDETRAQACVDQIALSGSKNNPGGIVERALNDDPTVRVENGVVKLNRNNAVLRACSLSEEEVTSAPDFSVNVTDFNMRESLCSGETPSTL